MNDTLKSLYETVCERKENRQEGSYTNYLFEQGLDKILKKCGEECAEVIIAAKNDDKNEIVPEIADLIYHLTVLMAQKGVKIEDLDAELSARSAKIGNLKTMKVTDKNT